MTAEIALLNKLAVTLAADSAVTIPSGAGPKVYNSADKIFEGTNYDPIGVMVYNNPEINGVPIETIVKMYREQECRDHFDTVFDYAAAFLRHIEAMQTPELTIGENVRGLVAQRLFRLQSELRVFTEEFFRSAGADGEHETVDDLLASLNAKMDETLETEISLLASAPAHSWADGLVITDVIGAHGDSIRGLIDAIFADDHLTDAQRDQVLSIAAWSLLKEFQRSQLTGLVFAGFGQSEIFPSLVSYEVYGVVAGRLKYEETRRFDVDRQLIPDAAVMPFAQKEMVDRFMYGLDSEFLDLCSTYFAGAHAALKTNLDSLVAEAGDDMRNAVTSAIDTILAEFQARIVPDHLSRLRQEFSDMVRFMPKQELAALSESLVHITSLKRKFSAGAESVGGPIDVAMITRAEGFVWVKRKHYFDPALNPRYFHRHYGRSGSPHPEAAGE